MVLKLHQFEGNTQITSQHYDKKFTVDVSYCTCFLRL